MIFERRTGIFLFFSFFLLFFVSHQFSVEFLSPADPYYHIKHAYTYWSGEEFLMPLYSTMNYEGADLYWLYHLAISPFTSGFNGENFETLIIGSEFAHSLIAVIFILVFFYIVKDVLRRYTKLLDGKSIIYYSAIASIVLFFGNVGFSFRLFLTRPHILAILFVLSSIYLLVREKYLMVFIASVVLTLFYSISFILLIPAFLYILCKIIYLKRGALRARLFLPIISVSSGLLAGILIHPQSFNYFYNGYFLHIKMIVDRLFSPILHGAELYSPTISGGDLFWLIPVEAALVYVVSQAVLLLKNKNKHNITFPEFYFGILTFFFFIMFIFAVRALEYLVPVAILTILLLYINHLKPSFNRVYKIIKEESLQKLDTFREMIYGLFIDIFKHKSPFRKVMWIIIIAYFIASYGKLLFVMAEKPGFALIYRGASEYMELNSEQGDLVFHQHFGNFPLLTFNNDTNRFMMGMGPTFTYAYDPPTYWRINHIANGEEPCGTYKCSGDDIEDVHEVLKNILRAKFVFIDSEIYSGQENFKIGDPHPLVIMLEKDPRFRKVYVDEEYPNIIIFKIL